MEVIFRHLGFVRLDGATEWEIFFWLTPELIVLPTSIIIYFICRFLSQKTITEEGDASLHQNIEASKKIVDANIKVSSNSFLFFYNIDIIFSRLAQALKTITHETIINNSVRELELTQFSVLRSSTS